MLNLRIKKLKKELTDYFENNKINFVVRVSIFGSCSVNHLKNNQIERVFNLDNISRKYDKFETIQIKEFDLFTEPKDVDLFIVNYKTANIEKKFLVDEIKRIFDIEVDAYFLSLDKFKKIQYNTRHTGLIKQILRDEELIYFNEQNWSY